MNHLVELAASQSIEPHLELPHAHKGSPDVANNLEAYLLSGVRHLSQAEENDMDRPPEYWHDRSRIECLGQELQQSQQRNTNIEHV